MVNPISHDFQNFVFQPQEIVVTPQFMPQPKPFSIKTAAKTKKDIQKEKSPWEVKKPKQDSEDSEDSDKSL